MNTSGWKETEATVFTCGWRSEYQGRRGGYGDGPYLVAFSYEVNGEWYSGEFVDNSMMAEGSRFSLRYDPAHPERNDRMVEALQSRWSALAMSAVVACAVLFALGAFIWARMAPVT